MLYFDRIDVSEGIDINRSKSKKCDICHYWYFLNNGFSFLSYVCNRCHDLLIMSMNLKDIVILNIKDAECCCIISGITKSEPINVMQNINFTEKNRIL